MTFKIIIIKINKLTRLWFVNEWQCKKIAISSVINIEFKKEIETNISITLVFSSNYLMMKYSNSI